MEQARQSVRFGLVTRPIQILKLVIAIPFFLLSKTTALMKSCPLVIAPMLSGFNP